MQTLATITQQDIDPSSSIVDVSHFHHRKASRAILLDSKNRVYLLNVSLHGYHKLPGGGIHQDEDIVDALRRELLEEIGCKVKTVHELGVIVEFRDYEKLKQTSYCFIVQQDGEKKEPALEEDELAKGMVEARADSIDVAISILQTDRPDGIEGKFIQKRDLLFLQAAKSVINSHNFNYW